MKIDPLVFSARFPDRCRPDLCRSRCCRYGVWIDVEEMKKILACREMFSRYLRPEAADPDLWFGKIEPDPDCPSGLSVETMDVKGYCVFFHPATGCALQKAATDHSLHEWAFKPRFCIMFPLVVSGGTLTVDEDMKTLWCMKTENRTQPILKSVTRELRYLFEGDVLRTLDRRIAEAKRGG